MRIPTRDIPQADELSDVLKVVEVVAGGAVTFQAIAAAIEKVDRQGRYYRRAAEILGFIGSSGANQSFLTAMGSEYVRATGPRRRIVLLRAVLNARIFQRVIPFLESKLPRGCTPSEFRTFLDGVTEPAGVTMMPRRANTLIDWLRAADLVAISHERYVLCALPGELDAIHFTDDAEPLLPATFSLAEYRAVESRVSANAGTISYFVDQTRVERARASHRMLTNLVAARLRNAGAVPRCNDLVDLAGKVADAPFIFEMKSADETNLRAQIRRGVSQLYEYRYLQNVCDAQLVLVIQKPLTKDLAWMCDYLLKDRSILLVWDGDGKTLHCPPEIKRRLGFLVA